MLNIVFVRDTVVKSRKWDFPGRPQTIQRTEVKAGYILTVKDIQAFSTKLVERCDFTLPNGDRALSVRYADFQFV